MTNSGPGVPTSGLPAFAPGEAYYRALVESALDVVVVYNPDGTFRYVSPSVRNVFDLGPEDVVGKPGLDFVHPDDLAPLRIALAEAIGRPGLRVRIELRLRHRDGSSCSRLPTRGRASPRR
ncbi:MAG TPA: PAS domain-containing protein [Thermoanaerobaculia bacterium]|nr:PAS domain-containing protein [Thermoanaerobaculia bacterium]